MGKAKKWAKRLALASAVGATLAGTAYLGHELYQRGRLARHVSHNTGIEH